MVNLREGFPRSENPGYAYECGATSFPLWTRHSPSWSENHFIDDVIIVCVCNRTTVGLSQFYFNQAYSQARFRLPVS